MPYIFIGQEMRADIKSEDPDLSTSGTFYTPIIDIDYILLHAQPRTAYILFSQETRADVKAEEPDLKSPDVMKELGRRWRELDEAGRKPFHDMAEKDKVRGMSHKKGQHVRL